ncbi:ABC transporter ATP-binding protein [Methylobacterium aerolatum]|uniref:Branched-chain amino acid transport system ATP-binding protein n=1 Tax=Methylobacterium aerolatum TaxID=418708 RepID=A0ABU0HWW0_9HYPH|nr:ABC transporter ATP-binding protein [Methylobacterium aerolatum]MDQ0446822.1 branched-chain amino acid transport system ATP-binding protein [Methylobacterium aerolatum]GJD33787.1 High-affinity branched-chain amino acid transport ATP-binding protein LivF [Methylobacterium aerolatum]
MTTAPGEDLLRVEALEAIYGGGIRALSGVDLTVREGEIVALAGSNGAGKTTLLRAIANLLTATGGRITAGRVAYAGRDVARTRTDVLVRNGLVSVLEGRHCFRSLTVEENLIAGGLGRGSGRAELQADLQRVYALFPRLAQKRSLPAGLVSGGEQQMTAIGRALMGHPRLLVLDEPSMGLAPLVTDEIYRILGALNRSDGLTLLVAEQNVALALRHAHRCVVLETGRSILEGLAADLRTRDDIRQVYLGLGPAQRVSKRPPLPMEV